jgi:hypothetical protein
MLDWIFQIRKKAWATNKIMGDLLTAFKDMFRPQALLCSGGHDKKLDARAHLGKLLPAVVETHVGNSSVRRNSTSHAASL